VTAVAIRPSERGDATERNGGGHGDEGQKWEVEADVSPEHQGDAEQADDGGDDEDAVGSRFPSEKHQTDEGKRKQGEEVDVRHQVQRRSDPMTEERL
jgi:hypothetical protein